MRSRHALTAALALSVVTILTVAACGTSVQGSAQVNTAAAETMTTSSSERSTPTRTSRTSAPATDLSDLSSMLNDLPTDLSVPSDLTDLSLPTELTDLSDLSDIPGLSTPCLSVSLAYLSVAFAPLATLGGGSGQYDVSDLKNAIAELQSSGEIPPEIAPDIQTLADLTAQLEGKSLADAGQVFESQQFTTASDNVSKWLDANCGGS